MKRNKLAIAALVMGIVSFINLLGLEKGLMAIIIGWMAIRELKVEPSRGGKGMAWAGVILGALSMAAVIFLVIWKGPQFLQDLKNLQRP